MRQYKRGNVVICVCGVLKIHHCSAAVTWCCIFTLGDAVVVAALTVMMSFIWIMMRDKMRFCLLSSDRRSRSHVIHLSVHAVWLSGCWIKKLSSRFVFKKQTQFRLLSREDGWNFGMEEGGGPVCLSPPRLSYYCEAAHTNPALTASSVSLKIRQIHQSENNHSFINNIDVLIN